LNTPATCAPELDAEVAGLNRNFLDSVSDGELLLGAVQPDIVVSGPVQHEIIPTWPLLMENPPHCIVPVAVPPPLLTA